MDLEQVKEFIATLLADSPDFAAIAVAVAVKTDEARKAMPGGRLPYDLWLATLQMAGVYVCHELQVRDLEGGLYLKRRVGGQEPEWEGKLHLPGTAVGVGLRGDELVAHILRSEVLKDEALVASIAGLVRPIGHAWYPEPERHTTAFTLQSEVIIHPSLLAGGFERVGWANLSEVIPQHVPTVAQALLRPWGGYVHMDTRPR